MSQPQKLSAEELSKLEQMFGKAVEINPNKDQESPPDQMPLIFIPEGVDAPARATPQAAGYDLASPHEVVIPPKSTVLVGTGIYITIPFGWMGVIASRSGLGVKKGITVAQGIGIIDPDYRGEIKVGLYNRTDEPYTVKVNDKIAQLIFIPFGIIPFVRAKTVEEITNESKTHRGSGGFGSTDGSAN